jgi:hypothetical protein
MATNPSLTWVRTITFTDGTGFTIIHREPRTEEQWQADFKRIATREGKTIELFAPPQESG